MAKATGQAERGAAKQGQYADNQLKAHDKLPLSRDIPFGFSPLLLLISPNN